MKPTDPLPPLLFSPETETYVAHVAVELDIPNAEDFYTYRVPEELREAVSEGVCVVVPFGGGERVGYVVEVGTLRPEDPQPQRLRSILSVVEDAVTLDAEQLHLAQWLTRRTLCDKASAMRCIVPAVMNVKIVTYGYLTPAGFASQAAGSERQAAVLQALRRMGGHARLQALRQQVGTSTFASAWSALQKRGLVGQSRSVTCPKAAVRSVRAYTRSDQLPLEQRMTPQGMRVLEAVMQLEEVGAVPARAETLMEMAGVSAGVLLTLEKNGVLQRTELTLRRAPMFHGLPTVGRRTLTDAQSAAAQWARDAVLRGRGETALLFGVTASGKTEVYLNVIENTLQTGRGVIVLVPEIALTAQVADIFASRFGDRVALLHSGLSDGQRHDEWKRLQNGDAQIVVGPRSAAFAPVQRLGLVVVDEEHESGYKQENVPRYHARDVVFERAARTGAAVLLGSATPSIETFHAAETGRIHLLEMPNRIDNRPLPSVSTVDMRHEWRLRKNLFSKSLEEALADRISKGEQAILFLNRRGFNRFVLCRDCGHTERCDNCAISLTLHASAELLKCHHCDLRRPAPTTCPVCNSTRIRGFGVGTERVESEVKALFPSARTIRMDRDTTTRAGSHGELLSRFRRGEADILIGTQMVAKGLDFPDVTLVGVISADMSLQIPDFRATERTFQLLTQVAGRAGRGDRAGTVLVQTFSPENMALQCAANHDFRRFYQHEIQFRQELRYPPFSRIANIICSAESPELADLRCGRLAKALSATAPKEADIMGPAPCAIERLRSLWRRHVMARVPAGGPLEEWVQHALDSLPERTGLSVDIDPMTVL
jgi:primosomal protein N' (replication factor Y)